jgi:hypothetical protein
VFWGEIFVQVNFQREVSMYQDQVGYADNRKFEGGLSAQPLQRFQQVTRQIDEIGSIANDLAARLSSTANGLFGSEPTAVGEGSAKEPRAGGLVDEWATKLRDITNTLQYANAQAARIQNEQ